MKSKIGLTLAALYLLATVIIIIYSLVCSGEYCGMSLALPVMPWQFILQGVAGLSVKLYIALVLANSLIMYYLGYAISQCISRISKV